MNLSTPNLSLSPSRCPANSNPGKAAADSSSTENQGAFEEFFAGLVPRGEPAANSRATPGGKTAAADSDGKSASVAEEPAEGETESELNLKKKKSADLVLGVMVQMFEAVPSEGCPASGELPGATETACLPDTDVEEATAEVLPMEQDLSSPAVIAGTESSIATVERQPADEPKQEARAEVTPPESTPDTMVSVLARTAATLEKVPESSVSPARPRGKRAENSKTAPTADFAEMEPAHPEVERGARATSQKNFLTSAAKWVMKHGETLGTNVANATAEMSSAPAAQILENVFSKNTLSARVDAMAADFSAQNPSAGGAALFTGAQHAIEAVLEAGERFTTEAQRAVKMEFSVSGENLSVHVELHAGEVRTTFHTASAELRSALAHEWQVLAAGDSGRSQRFADPVFSTGSAATTAQGNGGESQGNHRGQEMNQPHERFEFSPRSGVAGPAHGADLPANLITAVPLTALRLHTFA